VDVAAAQDIIKAATEADDAVTFEPDSAAVLPPLEAVTGGGGGDGDDYESDGDYDEFDAKIGGGLFGGDTDVFNVMRTMLTSSGTGASVAEILEETMYEATVIKGYLDSIAQSLSAIADKYCGGDSGNGGDRPIAGRGPRGRSNPRRGQRNDAPRDDDQYPPREDQGSWEDEAVAE